MSSQPPNPCRNCGQFPLPGAPYCAYCGAPQFTSAPTHKPSWVTALLGTFGAVGLFFVVFFAGASFLPQASAVPWQTLLVTALLLCLLVGGVGLLPQFPGLVRGLGLGLIIGAIVSTVLLGGLLSCLEGLKNI